MAEFDTFTQFVNEELPKRISTNLDPTMVPEGFLFKTTGVGLSVELVDPEDLTINGKSAYTIAVEHGFVGTEQEWLESLKGKSAYQIAVELGYEGTESQWLESLQGPQGEVGPDGESAYQVAVRNGFEGTEEEWLESLATDLTPEGLQLLLNDRGYTVKDLLKVVAANGAVTANSGLFNFLFLFDKRIEQDLEAPDKASQYMVEMGRMEAEGYSYWKNEVGNGTTPALTAIPHSEVRLYDSGHLQVGSLTQYLELGTNSTITVVDGEETHSYDLSEITQGADGKSAYELALEDGFEGTQEQWLESLVGPSAYDIAVTEGFEGTVQDWLDSLVGPQGEQGSDGQDGQSAYQLAVQEGFEGSLEDWLASLKGADGQDLDPLTVEGLQELLSQSHYLVKDQLKVVGETGAVVANSGLHNFLFLFDKRIEQDIAEAGKIPQYMVEMGRMEAEGYSYWKNEIGNGTEPGLPNIPQSEFRLYDSGVLQIGSLTDYVEYGDGSKIRVVTDTTDTTYDLADQTAGTPGKSAYEIAVEHGFEGTEEEWLVSLQGPEGPAGASAYALAVQEGFEGSVEEWLTSLRGNDGQSAYDLAVEDGFEGDLTAWLESLKGEQGPAGQDAEPLTSDALQDLLNLQPYTIKHMLKVLDSNGSVNANSGLFNFLFLFDKRIDQDLESVDKDPQYMLEMGRMEAEAYSYWKNSPGNGTVPKPNDVPESEIRLYDRGVLQIGSLSSYIEFSLDGQLTVVTSDNETTFDLTRVGILHDLSEADEGKVLMVSEEQAQWVVYPFQAQFKTQLEAAGFTYHADTDSWGIDQGTF